MRVHKSLSHTFGALLLIGQLFQPWLFLTSAAEARPLHGSGTTAASCGPFVNGTTIGDQTCPSTPSRDLGVTNYDWQFDGTTSCGYAGNGNLTKPTGVTGLSTCAAVVQYCSGGFSNMEATEEILSATGPTYLTRFGAGNIYQAIGLCNTPLGYFLDTTQSTTYNAAQDTLDNATAGDALEWKAAPAGIPGLIWNTQGQGYIQTNGLTITMDTGFIVAGLAIQPPGQGTIIVAANGITLNGGMIAGALRVDNNATGTSVNNTVVRDCWYLQTSCILNGGHDGLTTLTNVLVYNGGDGPNFGQDHNTYISAAGAQAADTSCFQLTNFTSLNVTNDGWSLKLRPLCSSATSDVTNSLIGCTIGGLGCQQNGVVDYPCGGHHKLEHSVVELGTTAPPDQNAAWYMIKYGEETHTPANCSDLTTATNTFVLDHDIFINDAPTITGGNFESVVCTDNGSVSGVGCNPSALTGASCTVTNSVIVGNKPATGVSLNIGGCTNGTGNRFYDSRALAATGESWSGTFTDPTTGTVYNCCAFPWLPPHL